MQAPKKDAKGGKEQQKPAKSGGGKQKKKVKFSYSTLCIGLSVLGTVI